MWHRSRNLQTRWPAPKTLAVQGRCVGKGKPNRRFLIWPFRRQKSPRRVNAVPYPIIRGRSGVLWNNKLHGMVQDAFSRRSATQTLMMACRGTPRRFASLSNK